MGDWLSQVIIFSSIKRWMVRNIGMSSKKFLLFHDIVQSSLFGYTSDYCWLNFSGIEVGELWIQSTHYQSLMFLGSDLHISSGRMAVQLTKFKLVDWLVERYSDGIRSSVDFESLLSSQTLAQGIVSRLKWYSVLSTWSMRWTCSFINLWTTFCVPKKSPISKNSWKFESLATTTNSIISWLSHSYLSHWSALIPLLSITR